MATNTGRLWDYVHGGTGKGLPIPNKPLPIVTIATSAGTGSEMNEWGVICNEKTHEKIGFGDSKLLKPVLAVVDPLYMTTVPPKYTAYQGFDAFFHNEEVMM
jgi:alcohol dehydrogenase